MTQKPIRNQKLAAAPRWFETRGSRNTAGAFNSRKLVFKKHESPVQSFLAGKKILIVDSSALTRSALVSLLVLLGAKSSRIVLVTSVSAAREEFNRSVPAVLICEHSSGLSSSSELFEMQRDHFCRAEKQGVQKFSMLLTRDAKGGALADAARLDVDLVVLKPFSAQSLKDLLIQKIDLKLNHRDYTQAIREAQSHILEGNLSSAIEAFQHAKSIQPESSRFLSEQAELTPKKNQPKTEHSPLERKENFQCLVNLYQILLEQKNFSDAYRVIQKMIPYLSGEVGKVTELFRLATVTANFRDLKNYHTLFLSIESRSEELIKTITGAYVCGAKHCAQANEFSLMRDYLQKAVIVSGCEKGVLRQAISLLVQSAFPAEARQYLKRIQGGSSSTDYLAMDYLISDGMQESGRAIDQGWKLLSRGIQDPVVYEILIGRLYERGKRDPAENLVHEASRLWPEHSVRFQALAARSAPVG